MKIKGNRFLVVFSGVSLASKDFLRRLGFKVLDRLQVMSHPSACAKRPTFSEAKKKKIPKQQKKSFHIPSPFKRKAAMPSLCCKSSSLSFWKTKKRSRARPTVMATWERWDGRSVMPSASAGRTEPWLSNQRLRVPFLGWLHTNPVVFLNGLLDVLWGTWTHSVA